jgi:hypothetical protein
MDSPASHSTRGKPSGNLSRDNVLDNITLYWLTGTGASAARSYWEEGQENARAAGQAPTPVSIPVGFTTFPLRSCGPPAAGSRRPTPMSRTSTRWTKADTSPPGRSPICLRLRSVQRSGRSDRPLLQVDDISAPARLIGASRPVRRLKHYANGFSDMEPEAIGRWGCGWGAQDLTMMRPPFGPSLRVGRAARLMSAHNAAS